MNDSEMATARHGDNAAAGSRGDDRCPYCGRRCHVPVSHSMPLAVRRAYDAAGKTSMATCDAGARAEQGLYGASYQDVVEERIRRRTGPSREPPLGAA